MQQISLIHVHYLIKILSDNSDNWASEYPRGPLSTSRGIDPVVSKYRFIWLNMVNLDMLFVHFKEYPLISTSTELHFKSHKIVLYLKYENVVPFPSFKPKPTNPLSMALCVLLLNDFLFGIFNFLYTFLWINTS